MASIKEFIEILKQKPFIQSLIKDLDADVYVVGGVVRDLILGKPNKDIDLIIRKVPIDELIEHLKRFGRVDAVGKSFGVIKFIDQDGLDYDLALPRKEKPTGEGGYKGFDVQSDENLPIESDLSRRDAKFNAMAVNLNTGKFIDPLGGLEDIENKRISAANEEAFSDDPLRMLRIVQFASRFGFTIAPDTLRMIQQNVERIKEISPERILIEFDKILKKGNVKIGVELLEKTGLFKNIFGFDLSDTNMEQYSLNDIHTMGELLYVFTHKLSNPADFCRKLLKIDNDTYNEIKALTLNVDTNDKQPYIYRSIAHNIYVIYPKVLNSSLLISNIKKGANELLSGLYPKTVGELAVNGNDLLSIGLKGIEIGNMQKKLLIMIYSDQLKNNKEDLLNAIKNKDITESAENNKNEENFKYEYGCLMLYFNIPKWKKITSIIKPEDVYDKPDYGIENEPHTTILYGFHKEVTPKIVFDLYKKNRELKPISVKVKGISTFENPEFDVVKLDVESEDLNKLNNLMKSLPNTSTFPEYNPHMTIAYVKKGEGKKYVKTFDKNKEIVGNKLVYSYIDDNDNHEKKELSLSKDISEDVGEKYVEKKFGIKSQFSDFEDKYRQYNILKGKEEVVYREGIYFIIRNPKSLKNIGYNVRGVIDKYGNLYVENTMGTIHNKMLKILDNLGLVKYIDNWHRIPPTEFITVMRFRMEDLFLLGESSLPMVKYKYTDTYSHLIKDNPNYWNNIPKYDESKDIFQRFIDKARIKNPEIKFENIVYSEYNIITEGVGDKYAERKFGIPDINDKYNKINNIQLQRNLENPISIATYEGNSTDVYKNPKSLNYFDSNVRAISDFEGNLYVELNDIYLNHGVIAKSFGVGSIYDKLDNFVLLNRYNNTNEFGISDVEEDYVNKSPNERYRKMVDMLHLVKKRNPQYYFHDIYYEDIGAKMSLKIEEEFNKVSYSAIVLDDNSRSKLINVFKPMIPDDWEVVADHMTINLGELDLKYKNDLNKIINLKVTDYAIDDKVLAVGVEGYSTNNKKAHITIAVNRKEGGKPAMSNNLQDWIELGFPLNLTGKVTEVMNKSKTSLNESKNGYVPDTKKGLMNSKNISKELKDEILKYLNSDSRYYTGGFIYRLSIPKELLDKSPKVSGLGFGADKKGFFVYTQRARSKSYESPEKIPIKDIIFIDSTG